VRGGGEERVTCAVTIHPPGRQGGQRARKLLWRVQLIPLPRDEHRFLRVPPSPHAVQLLRQVPAARIVHARLVQGAVGGPIVGGEHH
jgi:hypothetical protein